ncbi:nucleolar complex protein 2 [Spatholobus suberectus]|nr:nucleolar complex protein 2 [Spatholobus suberectus]
MGSACQFPFYLMTLQQHLFSSVLVGEESSKFGNEVSESDEEDARKNKEGAAVFSSSWLPGNDSKYDSLFPFFSFFSKLSCTHIYTYHSCTYPCIDIGTSFFVVLLSECALLPG